MPRCIFAINCQLLISGLQRVNVKKRLFLLAGHDRRSKQNSRKILDFISCRAVSVKKELSKVALEC